jgi:4-amino-4-deoxy-L-arabinose transferase-like glycosyltransferase
MIVPSSFTHDTYNRIYNKNGHFKITTHDLYRHKHASHFCEVSSETRMKESYAKLVLIVLLFVALVARLYQLDSPSNTFHIIRQLNTALMVHAEFLQTQPDTPAWRLELARMNQPPMLEPPIIQYIALTGYRLLGREELWIPRSFSAISWVIGGYFMYLCGKQLFKKEEVALVVAAFYLFAPFGILASRSFQANPLMIALMAASLFTVLRYFDQPTRGNLIWAILATALANIVLLLAAFILYPFFAWVAVSRYGLRRAVAKPEFWIYGVLSLLPAGLYYFYGLFIARFLVGQTGSLFMPALWVKAEYWANWLVNMMEVIGFIPVILSIQALLTTRRSFKATVIRGLWLAYLLFGLLVSYPIFTHSYYSLPLIPITALTIGCIADQISEWTKSNPLRFTRVALAGAAIIAVAGLLAYLPTTAATEEQAQAIPSAHRIGELTNHNPRVIFLTDDYGGTLEYYGEISGQSWPGHFDFNKQRTLEQPVMTVEQQFQTFMSKQDYDYFVITSALELALQPQLKAYLDSHFPLVAKDAYYLVYDLRSESTRND